MLFGEAKLLICFLPIVFPVRLAQCQQQDNLF